MHALNGAAVALDAHTASAAHLTGIIHAAAGFADGFAVLLELTTDLFKFGHCQKPPLALPFPSQNPWIIVVIDITGDDKNILVPIEAVSVSDIVRTIYAQFPDAKGVNHEGISVRVMSANYISHCVVVVKEVRLIMFGILGDRVENGTKRRFAEVEYVGKTFVALTNGNARNFKIFASHALGHSLHGFVVNLKTFKHSVTSNHLASVGQLKILPDSLRVP